MVLDIQRKVTVLEFHTKVLRLSDLSCQIIVRFIHKHKKDISLKYVY